MRSVFDNIATGAFAAIYASLSGVVVTSAALDTRGYNSGAIKVNTTAVGNSANTVATRGTVAVVLEESTDNSTWATATDSAGTTIGTTVAAISTNGNVTPVRITGLNLDRDRYLRLKLTSGFGPGATLAGIFTLTACIEVGNAYNNPVTTVVSNS